MWSHPVLQVDPLAWNFQTGYGIKPTFSSILLEKSIGTITMFWKYRITKRRWRFSAAGKAWCVTRVDLQYVPNHAICGSYFSPSSFYWICRFRNFEMKQWHFYSQNIIMCSRRQIWLFAFPICVNKKNLAYCSSNSKRKFPFELSEIKETLVKF